jgi:sterol desaturase/sphingolipid hydroxylase (fatty acid hydroxylase superfamily)
LSFFWILEGIYPVKKHQYNKWKHAKKNLISLIFTMIINVVFGLITVGVFLWIETTNFGLLKMVDWPVWVEILLAIMILDFTSQYVVHVLLHKTPSMWRFHTVHHSNTHVDVTSGTRHHPIDFVFRETFALIGLIIAGLPVSYYLIYRI